MRDRSRIWSWMAVALLLLALPTAAASNDACCPAYDLEREFKLDATVERISSHVGQAGVRGLHATVRSQGPDKLLYDVHLGPEGWVKKRLDLAVDDRVLLLVSPISGGTEATPEIPGEVVARRVTVGEREAALRDRAGQPLWTGGHHHHPHHRPTAR